MSVQAGWYLVYSKAASGELKARDALRAEGFAVWLPQYAIKTTHARKTTVVEKPLFGRYLFVYLDPQRGHFGLVRKTLDVLLVEFDGEPECVPERVIRDLNWACVSGAFDVLPQAAKLSPKDYPQGMVVRVVDGPLAEFIGKIKAAPHGRRAEVLFEMFGKTVNANIPIDRLIAV